MLKQETKTEQNRKQLCVLCWYYNYYYYYAAVIMSALINSKCQMIQF